MTRFFYFTHSDKELPITKNYGLSQSVWILDTKKHEPKQVKFIDTKENDLLFKTETACRDYYN